MGWPLAVDVVGFCPLSVAGWIPLDGCNLYQQCELYDYNPYGHGVSVTFLFEGICNVFSFLFCEASMPRVTFGVSSLFLGLK